MTTPNAFFVGAPKSGTTALGRFLDQHPDIFVAPKELHYFATDLTFLNRNGKPWRISWDAYQEWFAGHDQTRYRIDRSVFYLYSANAAREIHEFDPASRVIAVVRDPVEQMHSEHSEMLFQGEEDLKRFDEALAAEPDRRQGRRIPPGCEHAFGLFYRDLCRYGEQLERYFSVLGRDQVHVVVYDDFVADPAATYRGVLEFLGVDAAHQPSFGVVNSNKVARSAALVKMLRTTSPTLRRAGRTVVRNAGARARLRRRLHELNIRPQPRRPMSDALEHSLRQEFEPEVQRLEELLGRSLPWHAGRSPT